MRTEAEIRKALSTPRAAKLTGAQQDLTNQTDKAFQDFALRLKELFPTDDGVMKILSSLAEFRAEFQDEIIAPKPAKADAEFDQPHRGHETEEAPPAETKAPETETKEPEAETEVEEEETSDEESEEEEEPAATEEQEAPRKRGSKGKKKGT